MRLVTQRVSVFDGTRFTGLLVTLLLCCGPHWASERHQGAIVCREEVSLARREDLAHKLQAITGWRGLNFDSNGTLRLAADSVDGGSISARNLIETALAGDKVLILEDASNRTDVVFARVVPGRWKNKVAENPAAFVVLIDFVDFEQLMGDRPALAAFNVGWGLLHEIDHVVNDSVDSDVVGHVGDCEDHINQMRRECHLPSRLDYFFRFFPNSDESHFRSRLVRLAFEQEDQPAKKHRRFWIMWDATQVGGLDASGQVAGLR